MAKSVVPTKERKQELDAVRKWAQENGIELSSRGRVPKRVWDAYAAAFVVAYAEEKNGKAKPSKDAAAAKHYEDPANLTPAGPAKRLPPKDKVIRTIQAKKRLVVRFDPETLSFWPEIAVRRTDANKLKATVLHYVENTGDRTPSGGKFTSQRFTVAIDGQKWVGQTKNGTDVVRLRPYEEAYPDGQK